MTLRDLRARLKPIAARAGLASSAPLWQPLARRAYETKLADDAAFRDWSEREAPTWAADHWGHEQVEGRFALLHVMSQLYELSEMLRLRLGDLGDARVLDAGASDGFFLSQLGVKNGVGVNFLAACARKIGDDGYASTLADVGRLPFAPRSFDVVICCETLEHVPNPVAVLDELARVTRGTVIVTIPWIARTRISARPPGWPETESHIFEFSEADFARIVSHSALRVAHRDLVEVFPRPGSFVLDAWLRLWMYPNFFPALQYYELEL